LRRKEKEDASWSREGKCVLLICGVLITLGETGRAMTAKGGWGEGRNYSGKVKLSGEGRECIQLILVGTWKEI